MSLFELTLRCGEPLVEDVSDALMDADALAVSVEDADADAKEEQALFGEPGQPAPRAGWQRSLLKALFPSERAATQAAAAVLAAWPDVHTHALQAVAEQDWVRLTQAQFQPVEITPTFWIVPSWHEAPAQARHVMRLDPGLAFGTGTHPTTRMCLRWLAAHEETLGLDARVLDYGCGSGILALAAAMLGATHVTAVDIDPAAVQATRDNAAGNGVAIDTIGPPDQAQGLYDVVLANILASPLKLLAPLLAAHVSAGGHLVLAGILARQAQDLQAAYAPWLALQVADEEDGWILMTAQRPA